MAAYTHGTTFIAGILTIFLLTAYYILGLPKIPIFPTDVTQEYLNSNVFLGSHTEMNAFATMYYYFMRDFGIIGLIILTILFSLICIVIFNYMKKTNIFFSKFLYIQSFLF